MAEKSNHPLNIHGLLHNKLNLFKGNTDKEISVRYIDSVLEESMQIVYENLVEHADENHRVNEDLRPLTVVNFPLKAITNTEEYTIYGYPDNFFRSKRSFAVVSKPGCAQRKLRLWKARANEINDLLLSDNWKPSFSWQTSFYDLVPEGIRIFHVGEFIIDVVRIDYYKKFTPLRCPAREEENFYTWYEGSKVTTTQETEFTSNYIIRRITDVAALIVERDTKDGNAFQTKLSALMVFEKLYS